jgi:hypothetical protein
MPKLVLQSDVSAWLMIPSFVIFFRGALRGILIVRAMWHNSTSGNNSCQTSVALELLQRKSVKVWRSSSGGGYMKRSLAMLTLLVLLAGSALAATPHSALTPVKATMKASHHRDKRFQRHRAHKAGKHHAPKHPHHHAA